MRTALSRRHPAGSARTRSRAPAARIAALRRAGGRGRQDRDHEQRAVERRRPAEVERAAGHDGIKPDRAARARPRGLAQSPYDRPGHRHRTGHGTRAARSGGRAGAAVVRLGAGDRGDEGLRAAVARRRRRRCAAGVARLVRGGGIVVHAREESAAEQPVPGLTQAQAVDVTVRGDKDGRVVTWRAAVSHLPPGTAGWDDAVALLATSRLNATDPAGLPARWAATCGIVAARPPPSSSSRSRAASTRAATRRPPPRRRRPP